MIIDCYGYYIIVLELFQLFCEVQLKVYQDGKVFFEVFYISDEQIQESIEKNQLCLLIECGFDMIIFLFWVLVMVYYVGDEVVLK